MSTSLRQAHTSAKLLHGVSPLGAVQARRSLPYHVLRNSQGSLPVYSDIRNQGSKYLLQVRNIEGDVDVRGFIFSPERLLSKSNLVFLFPLLGDAAGSACHTFSPWLG